MDSQNKKLITNATKSHCFTFKLSHSEKHRNLNRFSMTVMRERGMGLTSLMSTEAFLTAWKKGVSEVYLKLPLFFSNDDLYSLCATNQTVVRILSHVTLSA